MGLFNKDTTEDKKVVAKKDTKKSSTSNVGNEISYRVLVEPWITEASTEMLENNKYVFKISRSSNKFEIKKAIESLYKVHVTKINVINVPRKFRSYGRTSGWIASFKKAIVTLKEGDKIELFKGI